MNENNMFAEISRLTNELAAARAEIAALKVENERLAKENQAIREYGGQMKARSQSEHEAINRREYPGTRQLCERCGEPTERCEEK